MKKISDKKLELIIGITSCVALANFFLIFFESILFWIIKLDFWDKYGLTILYIHLWTFVVLGSVVSVLLFAVGGKIFNPPVVKADKMKSKFDNYDQVLKYLRDALSKRKYIEQKKEQLTKGGEVILFVKKLKLQSLIESFAVIRIPELTDEFIDEANDAITRILTKNNSKEIRDSVNMITMFCIDHVTPSFNKLINSNMQQGIKNGRLVTGICFEEKKLYIANQKDGFAIAKYKHLRKEFMDIMNLKKKKN